MTVILADKDFIKYYSVDAQKTGVIATIPWAATGNDIDLFDPTWA